MCMCCTKCSHRWVYANYALAWSAEITRLLLLCFKNYSETLHDGNRVAPVPVIEISIINSHFDNVMCFRISVSATWDKHIFKWLIMVQKPLEVLLVSPVSNSERGWSQYSFPLFFKYLGCVHACVFMPCIHMLLNVFFVALLFASHWC